MWSEWMNKWERARARGRNKRALRKVETTTIKKNYCLSDMFGHLNPFLTFPFCNNRIVLILHFFFSLSPLFFQFSPFLLEMVAVVNFDFNILSFVWFLYRFQFFSFLLLYTKLLPLLSAHLRNPLTLLQYIGDFYPHINVVIR